MQQLHPDDTHRFIKRWAELVTREKDLDWDRSVFCRDLRAKFSVGHAGDDAFLNWLDVELGHKAGAAEELLERAQSIAVVQDHKTWKRVGGFRGVRQLLPLKQSDRVSVLEVAKSQSKAIGTVVRERGLKPTVVEQDLPRRRETRDPDVVFLAKYIAALDGVPPVVMEVALRYAQDRRMGA